MEQRHQLKDFIVITSIFEPTEAIRSYSSLKDFKLVVVGDNKTPVDWEVEHATYPSVNSQNTIGEHLRKVLPLNHYCRKMMGYLYSMQSGAGLIIDTDDDNIPTGNWGFPQLEDVYSYIPEDLGFINIYQLYTPEKIWPRGLPLSLIGKQFDIEDSIKEESCKVGIWQGLVDEDPDVDAIYRLTNNTPCYFNKRNPLVLGKNTISLFNSQNTLVRKELFPLLYMPAHVTFRFTDILRGLVAQPIMWLYDYHLGFTNATVVQKRNPHNYYHDFLSEIPVYQHCEKIIEVTSAAIHRNNSLADNLMNTYEALYKSGIVQKEELEVLKAWLLDIELF